MYRAFHKSDVLWSDTQNRLLVGRWCYLQGSEWHAILFLIMKNMIHDGFHCKVTFELSDTEK